MEFYYRAVNTDSVIVDGTTTAENYRTALRGLKKQGLNVINLYQAAEKLALGKGRLRRPSDRDVMILVQQFCVLLQSGVALDEAIDSLVEGIDNRILSKQCIEICTGLRRGLSFSKALVDSGIAVPNYFHSLAEAGELTGNLGQALKDGLQQWEYELETRKKIINSLTYPAILIATGIIAVALIFVLVVPKFVKILDKSHAKIPLLARIVLESGRFLNENILMIGLGFVPFLVFVVFLFINKKMRQKGWDFLGRLPLVGEWLRVADIGRWSAMLATLLENRVDLLYSLELAQRNLALSQLKARFSHIVKAVRGGVSLAQAVRDGKIVSATGYNLIRVGERSGKLPAMLRSLAVISDESVKNRMQRFLLLIEPVAIIMIGAVVGLIMAGVILAITSMSEMTL